MSLTSKQKYDLNNMNMVAQNSGVFDYAYKVVSGR